MNLFDICFVLFGPPPVPETVSLPGSCMGRVQTLDFFTSSSRRVEEEYIGVVGAVGVAVLEVVADRHTGKKDKERVFTGFLEALPSSCLSSVE